jgi:hypothetical protein
MCVFRKKPLEPTARDGEGPSVFNPRMTYNPLFYIHGTYANWRLPHNAVIILPADGFALFIAGSAEEV